MTGTIIESQLGKTPKVLNLMGLSTDQIEKVVAAQKDPAQNPNKLFAADLAVKLGEATPESKNIALIAQAGKISAAADADYWTLKSDQGLSGIPKPYYTGKVAQPTAIDAQQATANLAANMVKEMSADRALISCLGQKVEDMVALTAEIRKSPQLTPAQMQRLDEALDMFTYHMNRLHPEQAQKDNLGAYTSEVRKQVVEGCAVSTQHIERAGATEIGSPQGGKAPNAASGRHY